MKTSTKIFGWLTGTASVLIIATLVLVYAFGPTMGAMIVGKPVFLLPPTPERYASAALDIMEEQGIHGDSPEFAAARAEAERMLDAAELRDYSDTWPALDLAIDAAGGKHSKVLRPEGAADGNDDGAGDGGDGDAADAMPTVTSEEATGGARVLTATVPTHGGDAGGPVSRRYAETLADGIARENAAGACGAIVDLRGNGGGDMGPMVAGLSALLPDGEVLWFDWRGPSTAVTIDAGAVRGGGTPITVDAGPKLDVPVAVLVDGGTGSSGEATMLAFRGLENTRSFGTPTAGYASANMVLPFPGGASLMLTVAKDRDRTGAAHMDDPVHPDETTGPAPEDAKSAALEWLSTRGCG